MTDPDARARRQLRRQDGVITHAQATACGMSSSSIQRRIRSGRWVRMARGIYRHDAAPPSWPGMVMATCLGLDAVASHRTAAALWGLDGFRRTRVEVVVGPTRNTVFGSAMVHRSTQFGVIVPVRKEGIPTTPIGRTLIDVGGVISWRRFEAAVDDALRRKITSWPALLDTYRQLGRRGRNGSAALRRMLDERFGDDRVPLSAWSRWVAALLTDHGLPDPQVEHRIERADGSLIAQVDLAYPHERIAIELQSVRHHLARDAFERDAVRAAELAVAGWAWLPVTWDRYRASPEQIVHTVRETRSRASLPRTISGGEDRRGGGEESWCQRVAPTTSQASDR